jgi:ankyrin repeat protein
MTITKNGYSEIVNLLLKCGVNITSYAKSPLYVSVKVGNTDIVSILLENNHFDPSQYDTFHQSPLFIASSNGDLQIVELLLKYNINPNICNRNCLSPLFMASKRGHEEVVKLLLKNDTVSSMLFKALLSPCNAVSSMSSRAILSVCNTVPTMSYTVLRSPCNTAMRNEHSFSAILLNLTQCISSNVTICSLIFLRVFRRETVIGENLTTVIQRLSNCC